MLHSLSFEPGLAKPSPLDLGQVRQVAAGVGAAVLYDAEYVGGPIAGGRSPNGADVITGSTYRSFGGPAAGVILTNDEAAHALSGRPSRRR